VSADICGNSGYFVLTVSSSKWYLSNDDYLEDESEDLENVETTSPHVSTWSFRATLCVIRLTCAQ